MSEQDCIPSRCPKCHSEDVMRITVAYERETKTNTSDFAGVAASEGGLALGGGVSKTEERSMFAEKLKPPVLEKAEMSNAEAWLLFGLLALTIAIFPLAIITIPAGIYVLYRIMKSLREQEAKAKEVYANELSEWENKWVCRRCGEVAPGEEFRPR